MKKNGMAALFLLVLVGNIIAQDKIEKWDVFELTLKGPSAGNPFMGTDLLARFTNGDKVYEQEGYYDGNGIYKIRFMPDKEGAWSYVTTSNKKELNNRKGNFECTPASKVIMVRYG